MSFEYFLSSLARSSTPFRASSNRSDSSCSRSRRIFSRDVLRIVDCALCHPNRSIWGQSGICGVDNKRMAETTPSLTPRRRREQRSGKSGKAQSHESLCTYILSPISACLCFFSYWASMLSDS